MTEFPLTEVSENAEPASHIVSSLNISIDSERGVASVKSQSPAFGRGSPKGPRSPTKAARSPTKAVRPPAKPRSPLKATRVQVRQKPSTFSKTTKPTPEEVADADFLDAVFKGQLDKVRSFIFDKQQDVNVADERGETALHKAVPTGDVELLRLLLQHNAIVDHTTIDGIRAVGVAVKLGKSEMVRMLSEAGADLAMLNPKDGSLLLHEACWAGHLEMVEELLATGKFAKLLETMDVNGRTPLHVAAFRSPETVCRALVAAGANAAVMDKRLNSPAELAGRMGRRNSKDYLLKCEAAVTVALAATKLKRGAAAKHAAK